MVETKEISELTRSNRVAMLSHISTVAVMVFFMIWESVRGQLSPVYMTIATVVGVIPLIGEVICWKSNTEHAMIKHLVSYGFSLFYINMSFYLTDKSDLCICNSDDFCCHHLQ